MKSGLKNSVYLSKMDDDVYISEAGFYQLLLSNENQSPIAKTFQDLVYDKILPDIRKYGQYPANSSTSIRNVQDFLNEIFATNDASS